MQQSCSPKNGLNSEDDVVKSKWYTTCKNCVLFYLVRHCVDSPKYLYTCWLSQLHYIISLFMHPWNPCSLFSSQSSISFCSSDRQQGSSLSSRVFEILVFIIMHLLLFSNFLHKTSESLSGAFGCLFEIYVLVVFPKWALQEKNNNVK